MITTTDPTPLWSAAAIRRLRDRTTCPVCDTASLTSGACRRCGADLTGPSAHELWTASMAAAEALTRREELRRVIPRMVAGAPRTATPTAAPVSSPMSPARPARGSTTVQSVLAVAGAGLFAVAAIVFTFFNPDLADPAARALPTLLATVVFLAAARWLARRGLRSSAETVGALGVVFVGLDVYTLSAWSADTREPWLFAALGTLLASLVLLSLAIRVGIRSWLAPSLLGVVATPAMLGLASVPDIPQLAGWLCSMAAGTATIVAAHRCRARFARTLTAERRVLTAAQAIAAVMAVPLVIRSVAEGESTFFATAACGLAAVGVIARATSPLAAPRWWSFVSGATLALATGALGLLVAVGWAALPGGYFLALALGPVAGMLVVARLRPPPQIARRTWSDAGALTVVVAALFPGAAFAALTAASTLYGTFGGRSSEILPPAAMAAVGLGIGAVGLGLIYPRSGPVRRAIRALSGVLAAGAVLAVTTLPYTEPWTNVLVGVIASTTLVWALHRGIARGVATVRMPLVVSAHLALISAAAVSWSTVELGTVGAPAIVAAASVFAVTARRRLRWLYIAVAYAYGLAALSAALGLTALTSSAVVSLTTTSAALIAIVTTFDRRVGAHVWWAILAVTTVPFLLGTLLVIRERSGWTALSTSLIFALALTLVFSRRRGLGVFLRSLCAAVLVPSLAVIVICLGAQFLDVSASPVTLPVIAVVVGCALNLTPLGIRAMEAGAIPAAHARRVGAWFEASTLVTGAIAVGLALVREAAGLATAALVLIILTLGSAAGAAFGARRHLWWATAAHATGALWVGLALLNVDVPEAYLLPPSIGAFIVGVLLLARGVRATALAVSGLAMAVTATLVIFTLDGGMWRLLALLAVGSALVVAAHLIAAGSPHTSLRLPLWVIAALAASAASVHAVRLGIGLEPSPGGALTLWIAFAWAVGGGALAVWAGALMRVGSTGSAAGRRDRAIARTLTSLGALWAVGGTWPSIHRDWPTIWSMWTLLILVLAVMVAGAVAPRRRAVVLPPTWFLFAVAFITAVVAWSPRDLRVEWFSLPLGAALLIIGVAHLPTPDTLTVKERGRVRSWPHSFSGSWALLLPGILVCFGASIAATFTDPLTWRAILVIVMALLAILVGARRRLAAPFVAGVVVLPIENVSAFSVQIGRGIESMPWWITLAAVGAVLLIIAVSYERREDAAVTQRLRDLR